MLSSFTISSPELRTLFFSLQGKLTVVLDLDGTLISSFAPRRAPRLPEGSISYLVGKGGVLNPHGVFVVERPGLREFFAKLSEFAGMQPKTNFSIIFLTLALHHSLKT